MSDIKQIIEKLTLLEGGWDINDPNAAQKQQSLNQMVQQNTQPAPQAQQNPTPQPTTQPAPAAPTAQPATPGAGKDLGDGFTLTTIDIFGSKQQAVLDTQTNTYVLLNKRADGTAILRTMAPYITKKGDQTGSAMSVGPATKAALQKAGMIQESETSWQDKFKKIYEADAVAQTDAQPAQPAAQPAQPAAQPAQAAKPAQVAAPETAEQTYKRLDNAKIAKGILKNSVKKANDLFMVNGYYIEDGGKTGTILHHMMANSKGSGNDQGTVVTDRDISFGQGKEFADQLRALDLKITPQTITNPGIFGWKWTQSQKTVLTINLDDLRKVAEGKPPMMDVPPPPAPAAPAPAAPAPAAPAPAAPAPEATATGTALTKEQVKDMLATVKKLIGIKENAIFKSSIGRALLESFDLDLFEDQAQLDQMNKIWPQLVKWAETNKTEPEAQEIEKLRDAVTKWQGSQQQSTITPGTQSGVTQNGGGVRPQDAGPSNAGPASTVPDAAAVAAAGNHPPKDADAQRWAAVNGRTGAMYKNDTIGPGSRDVPPDTRVADLQKRLGITPITGVYGAAEKKAVEDLQKRLGVNVDGKFGPETKAEFDKVKPTDVAPAPGKDGKTGAADKASDASSAPAPAATAPADANKRLTVQPKPADSRAGKGPKGEQLFVLGDGSNAYWDKDAKTYVPYDINKKKVTGKPLKLTDFKISKPGADTPASATASTGSAASTTTTDPNAPQPGAKPEEINAYLNKTVPNAGGGSLYWVNGQLYSANVTYKGHIKQPIVWKPDQKFFAGSYVNSNRAKNKYTGPDEGSNIGTPPADGRFSESVGFASDELNRIMSIVHHR